MTSEYGQYRVRALSEGILLGLVVAISSEQGIALALSYLLVYGLAATRAPDRSPRFIRLTTSVGVAVLTFVLTLMIIGGPRGFLGAVRYNFGDVPKDQFWYFGALPSSFFWTPAQLFLSPRIVITLVLGVANAIWWTRRVARRRASYPPRALALAVLAVYGVLSATPLLARWINGYVDGTARSLIICALFLIDVTVAKARKRERLNTLHVFWPAFTFVMLMGFGAAIGGTFGDYLRAPFLLASHVIHGTKPTLSDKWERTLSVGENVVLDRQRATGVQPKMWSTYSSMLEATAGQLNPSFDYMIDALGPRNRDAYLQTFERTRPDVVQTIDPRYSPFEEWLEVTSWDFYRDLLTSYRVAAIGPFSLFWERLPSPAVPESLIADFRPARDRSNSAVFRVPADREPRLYDVEVEYETHNPWERIPLLGNLPRFTIETGNAANTIPVPLAPYRSTAGFPLVVRDSVFGLRSMVRSILPGTSMSIRRVVIRSIPVRPEIAEWIALFEKGGVQIVSADQRSR
jgi:hypothetical protein